MKPEHPENKRLYNGFRKFSDDMIKLEEERRMIKMSKTDLSANLILTHYSDDIDNEIGWNLWWKKYIKYHENMSTYHLNVYRRRYEDK